MNLLGAHYQPIFKNGYAIDFRPFGGPLFGRIIYSKGWTFSSLVPRSRVHMVKSFDLDSSQKKQSCLEFIMW